MTTLAHATILSSRVERELLPTWRPLKSSNWSGNIIEVTIFIPVAANDGTPFDQAHHAEFEAFVLNRFGGISLLPGIVDGAWSDAGITYRDQSRMYLVALGSLLDGGILKEVLDFAKRHYRQQAIFFRYLGVAEIY